MTSANISDMPIIIEDKSALELIPKGIGVLYNTREIRTGLDDSVAKVIKGIPQILRRSRGYVPLPFYTEGRLNGINTCKSFFASGGHLKSAFTLVKSNFIYLSQHLGA
jgi:hydrogenase maturation protein HypF